MTKAALQAERSAPPADSSPETIDLARVLALTEQVEAAIAAGEWQQAADLEAQRRATLVGLLERQSASSSIAPELRAAITNVVSRTHHLIGQAHHHRRTLLREASMIRLGRKAADEYEQNSV